LEEERASLKRRRVRSDAARRRKERDERQMDMYPPAREAVRGREGVERALMQTLTHKLGEESEADVGNDDGPPSVIVQNNPIDDAGEKKSPALDPIYSTDQDGESEITTEDCKRKPMAMTIGCLSNLGNNNLFMRREMMNLVRIWPARQIIMKLTRQKRTTFKNRYCNSTGG
jgi:hypothetical protein